MFNSVADMTDDHDIIQSLVDQINDEFRGNYNKNELEMKWS